MGPASWLFEREPRAKLFSWFHSLSGKEWAVWQGRETKEDWWVDGLSQALSKVIVVSLRLGSRLLGTQRASQYSRMAKESGFLRFRLLEKKNTVKVSGVGQSSGAGFGNLSPLKWGFDVKYNIGVRWGCCWAPSGASSWGSLCPH